MKKIKYIFILCLMNLFSFSNKAMAAPNCKTTIGGDLTIFIKDLFDMIKWIALAVGIALGMLDFFKAITGKDDDLKKAAQKFVKRLIGIVALFILPVILDWVLDISGIDHGGTCLE
ncbi:MAG: hypothetical protein HFI87_02600 [Bacilli bacterium]|nr:hypothetical protein [Bacilli bacterium]